LQRSIYALYICNTTTIFHFIAVLYSAFFKNLGR
jgi:hypothetical protein